MISFKLVVIVTICHCLRYYNYSLYKNGHTALNRFGTQYPAGYSYPDGCEASHLVSSGRIFGQISIHWPDIWPDINSLAGYLVRYQFIGRIFGRISYSVAGYLARYQLIGRMFGQISIHWPDIGPDINSLAGYWARYKFIGWIFSQISIHQPDIWPDISLLAGYLERYQFIGRISYSVAGYPGHC